MTGDRRLRIAHVVTTDAFAGTERYALEVGGELARRGHDVRVVGGEPAAMCRLLPDGVAWSAGATAPEALTALARGGRVDVVHSHITRADFVAAMSAPVTRGVRISTRHITARRGFRPTTALLARGVRAGLARELAVSAYVAREVETTVDAVVVNGVRPVPDGTCARERTVLVAQRLAPEKATEVALDAWAASGLAAEGWRLVVAGDGPLRTELESRAVGMRAVSFLGWVGDLSPLLHRTGILLAPAPAEPCGLTLLEAMAHGLPIVAPRSGGNTETLGREPTAATFDPGDVAGACHQLERLAADDGARAAYGHALRSLQRRELTLAGHVDRLEAIYHDAVGTARR